MKIQSGKLHANMAMAWGSFATSPGALATQPASIGAESEIAMAAMMPSPVLTTNAKRTAPC